MKVQGRFKMDEGSKMQAHISSGIVMDIAAFKVSHGVGPDCDTTTLQAKGGARNIPSGRWMKVQGKVQDASTHILRHKS